MIVVALVALAAACADEAALAPAGLSAAAAEGFTVAQANGCFACHGDGGGGGPTGPPLLGLAGAPVELTDGTTTVADTEYLRRSLTDPAVEKTAGYVITMPAAELTAEQIDSILGWLEEVGSE
jgi:cytochrome c oxidase subunit 2